MADERLESIDQRRYLGEPPEIRETDSSLLEPPAERVQHRFLPSEDAVQERLQQESRKAKQVMRAKQSNRNATKTGGKKSRQKASGIDI